MTQHFYIASIAHTGRRDLHITWWRPDDRGYTPVIARAGHYTEANVLAHQGYYNCGVANISIPCGVVDALAVPQPFVKPEHGGRYYDTPGPVVNNTRENWERFLANAYPNPQARKPRPEWNGRRRLQSEMLRHCKDCHEIYKASLKRCPCCGADRSRASRAF